MKNKFVAVIVKVVLIFYAFLISVVVGIFVGKKLLRFWFDAGTGSDATTLLVLPIAFIIPFLGALLAQFGLWFMFKSKSNEEN